MHGATSALTQGAEAYRFVADLSFHGQRCQLVLPGAFGTGTAVATGEEKHGLGGHAGGHAGGQYGAG